MGIVNHHFFRVAANLESLSPQGKFFRGRLFLGPSILSRSFEYQEHAEEHAGCTRPETIALHEKGAPVAAAAVRDLSDEQLARSGIVFVGLPPMTAEQHVIRGLLDHIDEHFGSIRKTIGG